VTTAPLAATDEYGVPPVSFRLIMSGDVELAEIDHVGQFPAGVSAFGLEDDGPLAIILEMDGLFWVTKFP